MKNLLTRVIALSVMVLFGLSTAAFARPAWAPDANETLLKAGIAVHSFGVSPDADTDGKAVLRLYNTSERIYQDSFQRNIPTVDTYTHHAWDIGSMGNVYGITIDKKRNIYTAASANWSQGYLGRGDSDHANVEIGYGAIGAGTATNDDLNNEDVSVLEDLNASGTVYRIDAKTGDVIRFATLPQQAMVFTHKVCEGTGNDLRRNTGPGLGNIVYDKFHNQFFVSDFSDGKIYRLSQDGNLTGQPFNTRLGGVGQDGSAYGLSISPDGKKLFFGTIEIHNNPTKPRIFSVEINEDGSFAATDLLSGNHTQTEAVLRDDVRYTQNIGGDSVNNGLWAAISDLTFTPEKELMVGVRVGCEDDFATSYNHGGVVYLLKQDANGKYQAPSAKVPGTGTSYQNNPSGTNNPEDRAGWYQDQNQDDHYNYDAAAIPLHPHYSGQLDEEALKRGPDDGYGGVAIWQQASGAYDFYATSADIKTGEGVHGFMQFSSAFHITSKAVIKEAFGYKSVESSTDDDSNQGHKYDYKGIGGDVEVLSVLPVSIGSYVWEDSDKDGIQDGGEPCINGATVSLFYKEQNGTFSSAVNLAGQPVVSQNTGANGTCGSYFFDNLPEGDYKVCVTPPAGPAYEYTPTPIQTTTDNNDTENDSNIFTSNSSLPGCEHESGTFTLVANSEPIEQNGYIGDTADNSSHDTWGNMTVDFGFIKHTFDLALVKKIKGDPNTKYEPGDTVTFTIGVLNQGNVEAKNVLIKDYIPNGLVLNDNRWTQHGNTAVLNNPIATIAPNGGTEAVEIVFTIDPNLQSEDNLVNVAEISSASNDYHLADKDSTPDDKTCDANNHDLANDNDVLNTQGCDDLDPAVVKIGQHFDLALIKKSTVPAGTVINPGDTVTFDISITNQGTVDATNVVIKDYVPAGLVLNDNGWTQNGNTASYNQPLTIAKGMTKTVQVTFKVDPNFQGNTIVNWAEIGGADNALNKADDDSVPGDKQCMPADLLHNNDLADINGCDDIDPEPIHIGQFFDLALIKKRVGALTRNNGETVQFEITVYNQGTLDASNIQVNDYIPSGLLLRDNNWKENNGIATLKTPIASIKKGENKIVKISFKIDPNFKGEYIVNNAEIASATNTLGKNDIDSTPATEDGSTPDSNDNDIADVNGDDDYDPAVVKVKHTAVNSVTATPTPDTDPSKPEEPCDCDNVTSNKANAMSTLALLLMLLGTLIVATKILRKEELLS